MTSPHKPEEIAIIGGGLGGCLTALMLAKERTQEGEPKYHITIIEKDKTLLNGASMIASRLHLGGEYPLHDETAAHCLRGALIWKLLMPKASDAKRTIYTETDPMKFLVGQNTQEFGENYPEKPMALTLQKYIEAYERTRKRYEEAFQRIKKAFHWNDATAASELFGSYKPGEFYKLIAPHQNKAEFDTVVAMYSHYRRPNARIVGGFQSPELGLNVPKYLAMIQYAVETQDNITVRTNHEVIPQGIHGKFRNFDIECANGAHIHADQVVQAAWQGGPAITPELQQGLPGQSDRVSVYRRAMLLVKLPRDYAIPPAFVMLGEDGGMLAPYNDEIAICYLPTRRGGHIKECELSSRNPRLPADWKALPDGQREKERISNYMLDLEDRFPILHGAEPLKLIIRDTINFHSALEQRPNPDVVEHIVPPPSIGLRMGLIPRMNMEMQARVDMEMQSSAPAPQEFTHPKGLFTLYPTKATYGLDTALQAAYMVNMRSRHPEAESVFPPTDPLSLILSKEDRQKYSLANMKVPDKAYFNKFFEEHPDLDDPHIRRLVEHTWAITVKRPSTPSGRFPTIVMEILFHAVAMM